VKYAIIMAGGSGTRFWPKSSKKNPKQLLSLTGRDSQLQVTCKRLQGVVSKPHCLIVCTEKLKSSVLKHVPKSWVLPEPQGRNTMAAVCWGAWSIKEEDPDALIAVLPADSFIKDVKVFQKALNQAYHLAETKNRIVCLGIKPTFGATAYGYIHRGLELSPSSFEIKKFVEKPDNQRAEELFQSKEYLWNAGIFIFKAKVFIEEVRTHAPEFFNYFEKNINSLKKVKSGYGKLPSVSIDVALMEKTTQGAVMPGDFGWNDLGSWPALSEVGPANCEAGVVKAPGGVLSVRSKNIIADIESKRFLGLVGVENIIVVETKDAILVCHRDQAQEIRTLVNLIEKNKKLSKRLL
jgi:mannose-1-phosphate guanylyltransferase